jgi:uroporphyrin-III C-methyltransferase
MFGRGGEECEALRKAGIPFEVVNGITAGMAAPSAMGIALTHRGLSRGVIFVTGHESEDDAGEGSTDWAALARTGMTLVIYMGVARCALIQRRLLDAGLAAHTPVAVVGNATRRDEMSLVARLGSLAADLVRSGIGSPAIIVVGDVAAMAAPSGASEILAVRPASSAESYR